MPSSSQVLHVVDHLVSASGVASVVMQILGGVCEFRQDVAVYGRCEPAMEEAVTARGGKVIRLPYVTHGFGVPFAKAVATLFRHTRYDIVHGHVPNSAFMYLRAARRQGIRGRIMHAHSAYAADTALKRLRNLVLIRNAVRHASCLVAVSAQAAKSTFGRSFLDTQVIHNGVDAARFQYNHDVRQQVRRELGIDEGVMCVGHVGRFSALKNHPFLLDIFAQMRRSTDCVLVLVGDGPLLPGIQVQAQRAGLSPHVKFMGARDDAWRMYQAFDVFLMPSLYEGFGLAAVEAMCAGLGCVVSEAFPIRLCEHFTTLPLGDAGRWAQVAIELAGQPRHDGVRAVEQAGLDSHSMCGKLTELYTDLIRRAA